ncbi:MAG: peptidylprolyl isomerase [Verrucomicrobiales bacterium]
MLRVNGELVDPELVEETFARIKSDAEARMQASCCERDAEFLELAEEEVANSILIAQEAERRFPEVPEEEVREKLEALVKQYREHGASWELLEAQRDSLREECAAHVRMEKLIAEVAGEQVEASEEEVRDFYAEHAGDYRREAEARCLHLLKLFNEHEDTAVLYREMVALRERALEGEDFEALAKAETEKQTGAVDLGWIDFDRPGNPFEAVMFSLREGEISPVLAYDHAYHLVKVLELRPARVTPLEEVCEELAQRVVAGKKQVALKGLAAELRERAEIRREDYSRG